jgi:hypothetical protein
MSVNKYFQSGVPTQYTPTQRMYERLIIQSIQVNGSNVYYMPRQWVDVDEVFTEDALAQFPWAIQIEMYLDNAQGFEGNGSFMSKFGIEIQDTCTFVVAKSRWDKEVGRSGNAVLTNRPTEGDLIYFPLSSTMFEIKKVTSNAPFYQLGKLFVYKIDCEVFRYSSERLNTGIPDIDNNPYMISQVAEDYILLETDGTGLLLMDGTSLTLQGYDLSITSPGSQNDVFQSEADVVIDWSETNPFAELSR